MRGVRRPRMVAVAARGEPVDRQAATGAGDDHGDGRRRLAERERRAGRRDEARGAGAGEMVRAAGGGRLGAPGAPGQAPQRERKQRGDLRGDAARPEQRLVHAGHQRGVPAGLAVGEMAGEAAAVTDPERAHRAQPSAVDRRLDLLAALAAGQLLVLLAELATRAEQAALDHLAGHVEALADLVVGHALELAHHQQLVMGRREAAEGAAEVIEPLLALDRGRRGRDATTPTTSGGRPRTRRRPPAAPRARGCRGGTRRCTRSWRSRRSTA